MKVRCPCCKHVFLPFEDDIIFDGTVYDDQYAWITIPALKSTKNQKRYHPRFISECYNHDEQHDCTRGDVDNDSLEEESS